MRKVYLAGPINGCTDGECSDWRGYAAERLNAETLDPMRRDFRGREEGQHYAIVTGDMKDIRECDVLLVNGWKPSWGTAMEVFYAAHTLFKPVVMVVAPGAPVSPWQRFFSRAIVESLDEGIAAVNEILAKG